MVEFRAFTVLGFGSCEYRFGLRDLGPNARAPSSDANRTARAIGAI